MTEAPPRPYPRWFLAVCLDCTPILPQPFLTPEARDQWAAIHRSGTGHRVSALEEM